MIDRKRLLGFILAIVLLLWIVAATWLVPAVIRDAYNQQSLDIVNRVISGRDAHPLSDYLSRWSQLAWQLTAAAVALISVVWVAVWARTRLPGWERVRPLVEPAGLVATLILTVSWAVTSLWFPFGWDHGIMSSIGDVILRGGMPYKDGWDMKGPAAYYPFALAQALLGRHLWSIRVLDLVLAVIACSALARMIGTLARPLVGAWAGLVLFLWYASLGYFLTAQPDGWVGLALVLAFAPLIASPESFSLTRLAAGGAIIGLATLVKPFFGAFLLVPAAGVAYGALAAGARRIAGQAVALAAGFTVPIAVCVIWFATRGALDDFVSVHFVYATSAYSGISTTMADRINGTLRFLWGGEFAVALPILFLGLYFLRTYGRGAAGMLIAWAGIALFSVVLQGKFFAYHWIPLFPPLVAISTLGLWRLTHPRRESQAAGSHLMAPVAAIVLAVCLVRIAYKPAADVREWIRLVSGATSKEQYYAKFGFEDDPFSAGNDMEVAQYVASRTSDGDYVLVFGNNASINFLSGRPSPTRFVFAMPVTRSPSNETRTAYRKEYLEKIAARPPVYIVVGMAHEGSKVRALEGFPEFAQLLSDHYVLEKTMGYLDVYRRVG